MFGLKDISVDFLSGIPAVVGLALAVLLTLSFVLYRRTNPPLPLYLRIILGTLRVIAILALVSALFEPVVHYFRVYERPTRIAVLLDNSSSMKREELGMTRSARLDSLRSGPDYQRIAGDADLRTWYFAESVTASAEAANADKTALGEAILELSGREMAEPSDYWLLFSDGKSNSGRLPVDAARGLTVPINTINIASDTGDFDVSLTEIDFNPVVFVGQKTELKARLNWQSAEGQGLVVRVADGGKLLDEKQYTLSQEDGFGEVSLSYVPAEPGQKLLRIQIPAVTGEETTGNNEKTIAVKVLKSRLIVLLVTARPDYEVGFLHRYLLQSEKYDVDLVVTGPRAGNLSGQFPAQQTELNRYDLVVLHDPDPSQLQVHRDMINSYLSEKGGSILVMMGPRFATRGPTGWFDELLPFSSSGRRNAEYRDFQAEPAEAHLFHPVLRLADDPRGIREIWATLPPFKSLVRCDQLNPDGVVLATVAASRFETSNAPVLGYMRHGPGKLVAASAMPWWHWKFINLGFGEDVTQYGKFFEGTFSWLTVPEDFDPIRIAPDKEVFNRGERIGFSGYAFDVGFRPIPGVGGTVQMERDGTDDSFDADLIDRGEGKFSAVFSPVPPGKYSYRATFEKAGQLLKSREGEIMVESFSLEEFDQRGDPNSLMAVARQSGGDYFNYRQFAQAVASLDTSPVTERSKGEIVIWGRFWLLFVFVGALALEWVIRKASYLI